MKRIKLHTPIHTKDSETQTEYDVNQIITLESVKGDEDQQGTHFRVTDSPKPQFCLESANQLRKMIAEAKSKE